MVLVLQVEGREPLKEVTQALEETEFYVTFGGGIGAFGTNFTVFSHNGTNVWVDVGAGFSDEATPGLYKKLPCAELLTSLPPMLIVLTHGHEDHIGAMPHVYSLLPKKVKVMASPFTWALVKLRLSEHKLSLSKFEEITIDENTSYKINDIEINTFFMPHSIPQMFAVGLQAASRKVFFSSDFKLKGDEPRFSKDAIKQFGPVNTLFCDSTGALSDGSAVSESDVHNALRQVISAWQGRVFLTTFASHVERIQFLFDLAADTGRSIGVQGYSIKNSMRAAFESGEVAFDLSEIQPPSKKDKNSLWIISGCQGDFGSSLDKLINAKTSFNLNESDLFIYSSSIIPGNEKKVFGLMNTLSDYGVTIQGLYSKKLLTHTSGHAKIDDIIELVSMLNPNSVVPIHGDALRFHNFKRIIEDRRIDIVDNASVYRIDEGSLKRVVTVDTHLSLMEPTEIHSDFSLYKTRVVMGLHGICVIFIDENLQILAIRFVGVVSSTYNENKLNGIRSEIRSLFNHAQNKNSNSFKKKFRQRVQQILCAELGHPSHIQLAYL